jgi:hypothetical protein
VRGHEVRGTVPSRPEVHEVLLERVPGAKPQKGPCNASESLWYSGIPLVPEAAAAVFLARFLGVSQLVALHPGKSSTFPERCAGRPARRRQSWTCRLLPRYAGNPDDERARQQRILRRFPGSGDVRRGAWWQRAGPDRTPADGRSPPAPNGPTVWPFGPTADSGRSEHGFRPVSGPPVIAVHPRSFCLIWTRRRRQ